MLKFGDSFITFDSKSDVFFDSLNQRVTKIL